MRAERFTPRRAWPTGAAWSLLALLAGSLGVGGEGRAAGPEPGAWGPWVEADFPFFSSVLDARAAGGAPPKPNLTPRGLVLNLGEGAWACFDTELLRMSAVWVGPGVSPKALAPGSHHNPSKKTPGGQFPAPEPEGRVWLAASPLPGWSEGREPAGIDPREPAPTLSEIGRGALPEALGRFKRVRLTRSGAVLEYEAHGVAIREWSRVAGTAAALSIERHVEVAPSASFLTLTLGPTGSGVAIQADRVSGDGEIELLRMGDDWVARVGPRTAATRFVVALNGRAKQPLPQPMDFSPPPRRWPEEVVTGARLSQREAPFVVDSIDLPTRNPWRRNVRPSDIQFLPDGTGVCVTLDGDIWLARGLEGELAQVRWSRFASGLHEPLTCAIRDGEIFVFDRNGIWRLLDTDGNGEADCHELFSNAFAQTADMREFPSTLRLAPAGEFVVAKGGQEATTLGKHNGSVLRVSADGAKATVLGYGFRQPNIGVHPKTGLVTSSDQQGHYIPTTPLHIVRDGQFYGFLSDLQPKEAYPAPIADPLTWIPHSVNASGMSQVWLFGARMGPLNETMVHIGFNRPELFSVLLNERSSPPQAAVVSLTRAFDFPPLNGSVNPLDGQLYLAGFQVLGWGNSLSNLAGFGRVRHTGAPAWLPTEITPMAEGVLLEFPAELDPASAGAPENFSLASWDYRRTPQYGSPHYKRDGSAGQDWLTPSSAYLSLDGRSVFVGVPGMRQTMQLRVGWSLRTREGAPFESQAHTTPRSLPNFNPEREGFGGIRVDLTPRAAQAAAVEPPSADQGRRIHHLLGCAACHAAEANIAGQSAPPWNRLLGSKRQVWVGKRRVEIKADAAYLRESILDPAAKVVEGYQKGEFAMPSYAGVVGDAELESLVLYISSLQASLPSPAEPGRPEAELKGFE